MKCNKILFYVIISSLSCALPAQASNLKQALAHCVSITSNHDRLTCYDKLTPKKLTENTVVHSNVKVEPDNTKPTSAVLAPVVDTTSTTVVAVPSNSETSKIVTPTKNKTTTVVQKTNTDDFGKQHLKKEVVEADESVVFVITKLKTLNYNNWQITFKNGQIWRQKDSKRIKLKTGDSVKLSKGFMSAVYLQKLTSNKRISVKRVK